MTNRAVLLAMMFCALVCPRAQAAGLTAKAKGERVVPVALDPDFEFRKTKLYLLDPNPPKARASKLRSLKRADSGPDASITFERAYRAYGAVTALDNRQLYGHYYDFFWRAKRQADVTVRLEFRQEKLRSFVQAREVNYRHARGTNKTEFRVIGDDFFDDGKIIAWRCLLIEQGRIVAENRSYLWE